MFSQTLSVPIGFAVAMGRSLLLDAGVTTERECVGDWQKTATGGERNGMRACVKSY